MSSITTPSSASSKSASKASKQTKKIIIRLSPELLAKFPSDSVSKATSSDDASPLPSSTPIINAPAADKPSDSNASPAPSAANAVSDDKSLAPPQTGKRKGVPGPKPGSKRSAAQSDTTPKPRGKPGPKKKPRLADGTIDRSNDTTKKGPFGGPAPINAHKLGPKANTGAINAGLRALDRSGKPCRRWERKGFSLQSITGVSWTVGSWSAPPKDNAFSGDVKSESSDSSETKVNMESSAVLSERSHSGVDVDMGHRINGLESSPARAVSTAA